jgi:hypothetical protein
VACGLAREFVAFLRQFPIFQFEELPQIIVRAFVAGAVNLAAFYLRAALVGGRFVGPDRMLKQYVHATATFLAWAPFERCVSGPSPVVGAGMCFVGEIIKWPVICYMKARANRAGHGLKFALELYHLDRVR